MSLLDLINRIMHTIPAAMAHRVPVSPQHDVWAAHAQVERMQRDMDALNVAVSVAEARFRAHGLADDS